jgi:hypothetical protein
MNYELIVRSATASVVQWPEVLATDPEARVRFPAIADFLRSSGSGTVPISLVSTTEELFGKKVTA